MRSMDDDVSTPITTTTETGDSLPDVNGLDEGAAAASSDTTRDALAQTNRQSELDLQLELDLLTNELECLLQVKQEYMLAFTLIDYCITRSPTAAASANIIIDANTLLDEYERRLCETLDNMADTRNVLELSQIER